MPTGRPVTLGSLNFDTIAAADLIDWRVRGVDGWENGSASTLQTLQKLRAPGGWRSSNPQFTPRPMTLRGSAFGPDLAARVRACEILKSAATLDETTLTVNDPGYGARSMRVSRKGEVLIKDETDRAFTFSVSLEAADPRKFGVALTASTGLPSTTGGLTLPAAMPWTYNATVVSGSVSFVNVGKATGPVTLRISGPVTAPQVVHIGPDGSVDTFSVSLTLAAGQWLDVDMEAQTVLAQGQSSRATWVTSAGWSGFKPGNNSWYFSAASADPAASLSVTATPSWE